MELEQNWEQFSVEVGPEKAEHISLLLSEILPGSLVVERNYGDLFPDEVDAFQGPVRIYGYYPTEESPRIRERIRSVLRISGISIQPEFSDLIPEDWSTAWQERYQPILIGERLIVVPSWLANSHPDRLAVFIDPGMAFGSGTHPTTQLSLSMLEESVVEIGPEKMIDVGCGSGILSIAAAKLGVEQVLGVDTDLEAVQISLDNASANGVTDKTAFQQGSVLEILAGRTAFRKASLVVVNIIAAVLKELFAQGLDQLVSRNGRLLLCGILDEQAPGIKSIMDRSGFLLREERQMGEWVGLVGERVEDQ